MSDRLEKLIDTMDRTKDYLLMKVDEHDWHGVSDAANDLREFEIEYKMLLHWKKENEKANR